MNTPLLSFNNGEVSPYLRHRIDVEKMSSSSELFENFIATPYGAATKRPGLLHSANTSAGGQNSHLHPFISTDGARYLLHFTPALLTIYRENGTVSQSLPFLTTTTAATENSTTGFWSAPLRELQIEAVNDVLFIAHPDTHPLRLSRLSDTSWSLDFIPFTQPPTLDANTDEDSKLSIYSNPFAPTWAVNTSYPVNATILTAGAEWTCLASHTSSNTTKPGEGASWKNIWRRKIYQAGDPITISAIDSVATPFVEFYGEGEVVIYQGTQVTGIGIQGLIQGKDYICTQSHTTSALTDDPGFDHAGIVKWKYIYNWTTELLNQANLIPLSFVSHNGNLYFAYTSTSTGFVNLHWEPGVGQWWEQVFELVGPYPSTTRIWTGPQPVTTGDVVSYNGQVWEALNNLTPVLTAGGITNLPEEGVNWQAVGIFKPAHTSSSSLIVPIVRSYPLHATAEPIGLNTIWICTEAHTPNSWVEEPNREANATQLGITHRWQQVLGSIGVSRPPGTYCESGNGHIHLNISNAPAANSPSTPTSNATWQYIRPYSSDFDWGTTLTPVTAGTIYSYLGDYYRAFSNFNPIWKKSGLTPTLSGDTGLNTDFSNPTIWEHLPDFTANSAGSAWRMAPRRDEKDFQTELGATTGNNGNFSPAIAMQGAWNFNTFGSWSGTFIVQRSSNNGITWETIRSFQATNDRNIADSGTEDVPVLLRIGFTSQSGTASGGSQRGVLTPESQSIAGYAQATTYVNSSTMKGVALTPLLSGLTSDWSEGAFSTARGFPRTLTLHESRLAFASTTSHPVSLWLSQTDDFLNFEQGTDDTDSIFVTLGAPYQYPIRWIESQRRLFIGTAAALWVAGSETSDASLSPTNFNARQYAATGSSTLRPLLAADSLFFTDRKGSRLYQVSFSADSDSYEPTDLSRLAEHLTQPGLAQLAWQQTREPAMWAITREGKLLQFCYSRRDNLMAWSQHTTEGGKFRNVAILPSDNGDDDVFFIVERAGGTSLERLPQHFQQIHETGQIPGKPADPLFPYHYLDGVSYSGVSTTSLSIPPTLIGQSLTLIAVSANGTATITSVTPSSSPLTIPATTRAILGKRITSRLSSLPIDFPGNQSLTKRLHKIALSLFRSFGGKMYNAKPSQAQVIPYQHAELFSGWKELLPDLGNRDEVQVHIVHDDPYPFTVRAVSLRMTQGER